MEMGRKNFQPDSISPQPRVSDRLDSWKEIAAYLKRDIRTVQRWEKEEGLPVQRLYHKRQGSVYTYKSDVDAWMQQRDFSPQRKEATRLKAWRQAWIWVLAALAVPVVSYVAWQSRKPAVPAPVAPLKLVVLPFETLSGDSQQEYFSDGLTEEMIAELGRINPSRLSVIARTSAMAYKKTSKSVRQIARELDVDYLLEGSVRREGNQVRIIVLLIAGEDETHLWAESYDVRLESILGTQRQVAAAVSNKIQVSLDGGADGAAEVRQVDPEAYDALLLGRHNFNRWSPDGFSMASEFFAEAVHKQPDYALAQAYLSICHSLLALYGLHAPAQAAERARAAANRALELDSSVGQAHLALGMVNTLFDMDWPGAGQAFRKATEALPNSSETTGFYGYYLAAMGRHAESIAVMQKAQMLDPLSPLMRTHLADVYHYARQYDEVLKQLALALELEPNYPRTQLLLERVYGAKGMYREAATAYQRYLSLLAAGTGGSSRFRSNPAPQNPTRDAYWKWRLEQLESDTEEVNAAAVRTRWLWRARAYAELGDHERALFWLEKAMQQGLPLLFLRVNPAWDPLRDSPRFQNLLRRMNFPP